MSEAAPSPDSMTPSRRRWRDKPWTVWRIIGWVFASLALLILIVAAYVWTHRYALLEDVMKSVLADQGVEAELSIDSITKERAVLRGVDLRADGQSIFTVDEISTDYAWREALNGTFQRLKFKGAKIRLTLDETGQVIDGWMPTTDESGQQAQLPKGGIILDNTEILFDTPYGLVDVAGDINVRSRDDIRADVALRPSDLAWNGSSATLSGAVSLRVKDGQAALDTQLDIPAAQYENDTLGVVSLSAASLSLKTDIALAAVAQTVPIDLNFQTQTIASERLQAGPSQITWRGDVNIDDTNTPTSARGDWSVASRDVSYGDAAARNDIAQSVSQNPTLLSLPVLQGFAPAIGKDISDVLSDADIRAGGSIYWAAGGAMDLRLSETMRVGNARQAVTLAANADAAPIVAMSADGENITLAGDVRIDGSLPLSISNLAVDLKTARKDDGLMPRVLGLNRARAKVTRTQSWRGQFEGQDIRLAPSVMDIDVSKSGPTTKVVMNGPIDLDAALPGGYVQGLKLDGRVDARFSGADMSVDFAPRGDAPVTITRFDNLSDWTAHNVSLILGGRDGRLLSRTQKGAKLAVFARDLSGRLIEAETDRTVDFTLARADAQATLGDARQDWSLTTDDARITTDDILSEGTVMAAPRAELQAILRTDAPTEIKLSTDAARLNSAMIKLRNLPLTLEGTAEAFTIDYGQQDSALGKRGMVSLAGDALPSLPLVGVVDYADGTFTGQARTVLPKAEDTEILVDYAFKDGAGTAKVVIPELRFVRGGLQPQNLVKALQGKIADVNGTVSAQFDLAFAAGQPLQSSGSARLRDLNFGTLPGPFTGVNTDLEFSSIFPLVSSGAQTMTVDLFDPGFPLADGEIAYELVDGGLNIISAVWPIGSGTMSLQPTKWVYDAPSNQVVLSIDNVSLGAFVERYGGGNLTATGDVVGTIPVSVAGVDVRINDGVIRVRDGGLIQYTAPNLTPTVDVIPGEFITLQDYQQFQALKNKDDPDSNLGKAVAFKALRNFRYRTLEARLDGPLGGEVELKVGFIGKNPNILAGTEFDFNITLVGELLTLARNLKVGSNIETIKRYLGLQEDEAASEPISEPILPNDPP